MEETRSRRKRGRPPPPPVGCSSFNRAVFPLLLAAAATSSSSSVSGDLQNPHARFILRRFLRARLVLLTRRTPACSSPSALERLLPEGLLILFPVLLTSRWPSVAALGAEVVGAAALYSLEANEMMASDEGVVKGLVRALGSKSRRIVKAALHAVMDLSTSPVGREQLWKASAVERLLWEGFAHVALHCWHEKEKELSDSITSFEARTMRILSVFLLHVAIRLTADCNPIFRKACLVAAKLGSAEVLDERHSETLMLSQKATFRNIMDIINASSNFMEVYKNVAVVQESNDDSLQWMRWLRHLPQDGADDAKIDFSNLLRMWDKLVEFKGNGELKDEFFKTKSKFCRCVVYEDACKMFHMLLEKYRRTRRQYMCGMLSLHSA
ncbi:hypothetical protein B296_00056703 [Ensete ventricosum]|uniref:Bifunctional lysine-specific demethylase and histidyl-hydroxylase n=1 Tax=Ensete ventricosum TaxID=4639 RepID=A0A426XU53_ENSVE|nr:hypothetical protein B296_00056703 [Ensete ventricosum]